MTPFEAITELRHEEKTEDNSDNSVESAKEGDSLSGRLLGHGIGISGGAICGRIVFTLSEIEKWRGSEPDTRLILVRNDTVPDDIEEIYAADGLLWTSQPNTFLVAETADLVSGRALDFACGEGRNAIWLAARGWRVTAGDHSTVGLAKGEELAAAAGLAGEWVTADVVTFHAEPAFDLVVILYLHLALPDMRTAVGNAADALAPGGTLLLVGHHPDNIDRGMGGPQLPEVLHSESAIAGMLPGLRIEKAGMVERAVDRAGVTGIALDTLVRATRD